MKRVKKVLATILAAAMFFAMATGAFAAIPSDVVDTRYAEAIETLGALGIMVGDEGTGLFRPDEPIKRSEFAKIAVTALGLEQVAMTANYPTKFPDVVPDHWGRGYINVATNQGLVIGDDVGTFRPDDEITYQEAMTILVRVIGHEPSAYVKGGYPTGFLVVGAENNISKNATAVASDPASRAIVAQMTFNALTVKLMEQTGFGQDINYSVVDKTLLKNKLGVEKLTGQVTATSQTRLNDTGSVKKDEVEIAGTIYKATNVETTNLLGYNVVFYTHENDFGEDEIILIRPEEGKNDTLKITGENLELITDEDSGKKTIDYWKDKDRDSRTNKAVVSEEAKLIYNGKSEAMDNTLMNIKDKAGFINLLDTDRNGEYDLVFVTEYRNIVVEDALPLSGKIIDKYGKPGLELDPRDEDIHYTMTLGGEKIDVKDLKEWDVLTVAASTDNLVFDIKVTREKVEGIVSEIDDGEVRIGNELYEIAANYESDIRLEDEGVFYLDAEGKIAAVNALSRISSNYAYILNAAMGNYADERLEVRVFTKEGKTEILKVENKVRLNGQSNRSGEDVLAALKAGTEEVVPQLVTYDTNSSGAITSFNTAQDNTATGEVDLYRFTKNFNLTDAVYKKATGKVGNVNVNKNTIVFDIPAGSTNPEDFAVRDISMFEDDTQYDAIVFDMEEDFTARALIVKNADYEASADSSIAIVSSITKTNNDDLMRVDKLYAIQNGEEIELLAEGEDVLVKDSGTLEAGDIIQYMTNSKGEISSIRVLFDIDTKDTQMEASPAEDLDILYGKVTQKFANSMNMTINDGGARNITLTDVNVYILDTNKTKNAVSVATTGDIQKYDSSEPSYVFVKIYEDVVSEVVIIKL